MTDLDPHERRGAHRARGNPWRAVLPSLLAVASVVSLIVALTVWRGQSSGGSPASFDATPRTSSTNAAVSTPPSATSTATPPASSSSSTSASPTATPAAIGVVVLNESGRKGLGGRVAIQLRAAGWSVDLVGNFFGAVPATTVYYPPGHASDASALAAALPGSDRIRPRFGNLSSTRLTVILTSNYPG
jgi:predicted membrane-bound mannosyltransferase